jgi:catechol 2,3-dioxygenase-like lactoylglutathione lyase family enzyme
MRFDPASQDVGNIVLFEHVNLTVPDQEVATDFYVDGLGFTRDPYLMVGTRNMWVNCGRQQFHLPKGEPQRFRGVIGLVVPDLDALEVRLQTVSDRHEGTRLSWRRTGPCVEATCPWGNRFRVHAAGGAHGGPLGIPYLEMPVAKGAAPGVARFYRSVMGAPAEIEGGSVHVNAGPGQRLVFREGEGHDAEYDGHHLAIYVADFSGPHRALSERGLVTREDNPHQFRFVDIVAPRGKKVLFSIEHEVRSLHHPLYGRPLVNRTGEERLP